VSFFKFLGMDSEAYNMIPFKEEKEIVRKIKLMRSFDINDIPCFSH